MGDMCGRPVGCKRELSLRLGIGSGADMCPASDCGVRHAAQLRGTPPFLTIYQLPQLRGTPPFLTIYEVRSPVMEPAGGSLR
jgi:hypothetical protein